MRLLHTEVFFHFATLQQEFTVYSFQSELILITIGCSVCYCSLFFLFGLVSFFSKFSYCILIWVLVVSLYDLVPDVVQFNLSSLF